MPAPTCRTLGIAIRIALDSHTPPELLQCVVRRIVPIVRMLGYSNSNIDSDDQMLETQMPTYDALPPFSPSWSVAFRTGSGIKRSVTIAAASWKRALYRSMDGIVLPAR